MKDSSSTIRVNEIYSNEIRSLLSKKIFSKSKHFYSISKPPSNMANVIPTNSLQKFSIAKYYLLCALLLIVYFINIFRLNQKDYGKSLILIYSLTKEQAIRNGSIKSLSTFLDSKGILRNSESVALIEIRRTIRNKKYKNLKTTLDIPLSIFSNSLSPRKRIVCWLTMCRRFHKMIKTPGKNQQIIHILKEYVFDEIVYSALNTNCIERLITTQSHVAFQPLIFEYKNQVGKRLMVWYSSNSIALRYREIKRKRFQINPAVYKTMCIDEHWVWTKQHKDYLCKHSKAKILVKKSMMFYQSEISRNSNEVYDVVIFDVTPHNDKTVTKNTVYTTKEMITFVSEILESIAKLNTTHGTNFTVHLKHKRKIQKNHSSHYSEFINRKVRSKEINLLSPNQNLYDVIKQSNLVIGFPLTSPVLIGNELNKPAIFYCSSRLLEATHKTQKPPLLQSKKMLYAYLEKKLVISK